MRAAVAASISAIDPVKPGRGGGTGVGVGAAGAGGGGAVGAAGGAADGGAIVVMVVVAVTASAGVVVLVADTPGTFAVVDGVGCDAAEEPSVDGLSDPPQPAAMSSAAAPTTKERADDARCGGVGGGVGITSLGTLHIVPPTEVVQRGAAQLGSRPSKRSTRWSHRMRASSSVVSG